MKISEPKTEIQCFQLMLEMRDGVKLNTFVYLPGNGKKTCPVILQRTPYGITEPKGVATTDPAKGWMPEADAPMSGSLLRGWKNIVAEGYAAVYQDTRGRFASEGEDRVYADDANDGYDTIAWIAAQPWCDQNIGMSGSSAGATTALAGASAGHPALKAFWAQVGGSSIYDDVVYEGQSIEMERLWLWVSKNFSGLSQSHQDAVRGRAGASADDMEAAKARAAACYARLEVAILADPPFIDSPDWMQLPLLGHPDFTAWQPFLDEILTHPASDEFRDAHNFRSRINIPGFHACTWYDIFLPSVLRAFQDIHARSGNQKLWIGPNTHYFVYETNFWVRDPYFEWFGHWLKDEASALIEEPPIFYSPCAWAEDWATYRPDDWRHSGTWPPTDASQRRLYLHGDGYLGGDPGGGARSYEYDPRSPNPTLGGRNMLIPGGQVDQRPAQNRPGYGLMYDGDVLAADLTLAGGASVVLHAASDCPDTDFIAKLIEVTPDGQTILLMDGVQRAMYRDGGPEAKYLQSGEVYQIRVDLGDIHHTVSAGSRLQVDVVSSNFPRRARNTNSGNPMLAKDTETDIRVAKNTVYHGEFTASYVEFMAIE
jgi:putative CocE/NonD family hydrolase